MLGKSKVSVINIVASLSVFHHDGQVFQNIEVEALAEITIRSKW